MSIANDPSAVFAAALNLPPEQRQQLAEQLVISLDRDVPKDAEYDRLLAEELDRRWEEYERGKMKTLSADEAVRQIKDSLRSGKSL